MEGKPTLWSMNLFSKRVQGKGISSQKVLDKQTFLREGTQQDWNVAQLVECLPNMLEALSPASTP